MIKKLQNWITIKNRFYANDFWHQ